MFSRGRILFFWARFMCYTLMIFTLMFILPQLVERDPHKLFVENGRLEYFQFLLLASAAAVLLFGAVRVQGYREMILFLAGLVAFAATREMDAGLDQVVPIIGWKFALAFALASVSLAIVRWRRFKMQFRLFLLMPALYLYWAGFIVAVPVAQLLGHGPLLEQILGNGYESYFKRMIEETGETAGYLLILAASLECVLNIMYPLVPMDPDPASGDAR